MVPFDNPDELSRLIHLLSVALEKRGSGAISWGGVGHVINVHPDPIVGLNGIRLAYVQSDDARAFAVFIDRSHITQAEPWRDLLGQALLELGQPIPNVGWSAIVGPDPYCGGSSQATTLKSTVVLGTFELMAGNTPYFEELPCISPSQIGCKERFISWPVQVRGVEEKIDRYHFSDQALIDLAILVSVLSLVFERPWVVRHQPYEFSGSMEPLIQASTIGRELGEISRVPVELPAWAFTAWHVCKAEQAIKDALLTYQEAVRLMDWHPSWALVAFMSALQTLGSRIAGNNKKQIRAALSTCLPNDKVTEIMKLHSLRGHTVHAGSLFGPEPFAGVTSRASAFNPLKRDPVAEFHFSTLGSLQRAVRSILIHHFESAPS
jgi:hypothetical protein